jgi:hypothetical protein
LAEKKYGGHTFKKTAYRLMTAAMGRGEPVTLPAIKIMMKHESSERLVEDHTVGYGTPMDHWQLLQGQNVQMAADAIVRELQF